MARDDGFLDYLHELLGPLGPVATRSMFGGHGVYVDGLFIAIVVDGRLYLKVDAQTEARFEAAGSTPFVYQGRGDPVAMSYWTAPESAMDSADEMGVWGGLAIEAAKRKPAAKKKKPAAKPKSASKPAATKKSGAKPVAKKKSGAKPVAKKKSLEAKPTPKTKRVSKPVAKKKMRRG